MQKHIFEEECCRAYAPRIVPFGLNMLGPVLQKFGTAEQQESILPRILSGEDWWCQGYSEPGAGSDLASLKTRAIRDGDEYVINGQKTWTTLGQHANKIFCLVRTSSEGKPQEGISFVLVDIDTPGIDMRPIRLIEGAMRSTKSFLPMCAFRSAIWLAKKTKAGRLPSFFSAMSALGSQVLAFGADVRRG